MNQSDKNKMMSLIYRARKKGFKVDEPERIIYFDYQKPEVLEIKLVATMRKKYNFRCQAQII